MAIMARIPRNLALQENLIKKFADVIHGEVGINLDDGWQIINSLIIMAATVAYRSGATLEFDVDQFGDSVREQASEALTFMIKRGK